MLVESEKRPLLSMLTESIRAVVSFARDGWEQRPPACGTVNDRRDEHVELVVRRERHWTVRT